MSLSYSEHPGDPDLKALLGTDTDFQRRIIELRDAKVEHDNALAKLNLGKAAKEALADAQAMRDQAARERDSKLEFLETEVKARKEALQILVDQTTTRQAEIMTAANAHLAQTASKHEAAQTFLVNAQTAEAKANAKADEIVKRAEEEAKYILDKANTEASMKLAEADRKKKETDKALAIAKDAVDRHQKALSLLTEAANQVGSITGS